MSTVTARIFNSPFSLPAACMMAWLPCTVANVTPRPRSPRTAPRTVSGTSKNLRSTNTRLSRSTSQSTSAKHSPVMKSSSPTL
ncbi:MAG: DUF3684 domain-containing protein [Burkholderiales bacterium]|nr:DUF3684 domain-containing protein [Burkholderiales bacterium]